MGRSGGPVWNRSSGAGVSIWEWLAGEMAEASLRDGHEIVDYAAMLADKLDVRISATQGAIRVEQALRTVIVASPEAVPAAQPMARAAVED